MFDRISSPPSEKLALRSVSRRAGLALLTVCALQLGLSFAAVWLQGRLHLGDGAWFHLLAVLSGMTVLSGAAVGRKLLGASAHNSQRPRRPASALDCALLVCAGVGLCMAGNLVGALVEQMAGQAGIEFRGAPQPAAPQSLPGFLLLLLTVAVLPAIAEEWLLRGVILPPLRPFGDGFAVACSAALFALLHQNMQQAPMAFVSGLALGWVYVRSGRLAVPMAVHLWNNAAAAAILILPDWAANIYVPVLGTLGLLSLFALYLRRRPETNKDGPPPEKAMCALSPGRRVYLFFSSAAMVLALVYFIAVIVLNTGAA